MRRGRMTSGIVLSAATGCLFYFFVSALFPSLSRSNKQQPEGEEGGLTQELRDSRLSVFLSGSSGAPGALFASGLEEWF